MKNFTNNFKQFTSRLSARWLIIALMMLVGTSSAWADKVLYLNAGPWNDDSTAWFEVWAWKNGSDGAWYSVEHISGEYYKMVVADNVDRIKLLRKGPNHSSHSWDKWNETGDISTESGKDLFTITGWSYGSWSATTKSYVLHGSFNNYTDVSFPANLNITEGTYQFKVKETVKYSTTTITDNWYGNDGTMTRDGESVQSGGWTMELGKNDCKITADVTGDYTFTFDTSTKKVTVTYPAKCNTTTFSWETEPVNMNYGETKDIVATLSPDNAGTVSYTASPDGIITFNDNQYTAVGKGDVTITATASLNDGYCPVSDLTKSIKVTCSTPAAPNVTGTTNVVKCGDNVTTNGTITIDNYENTSTYKLQLGSNEAQTVTPTNGVFSVSTNGTYKLTVTNSCGSSSTKSDISVGLTQNQVTISAISGSENICSESSESYLITAIDDVTYNWSINSDKFTLGDNGINSIQVTATGTADATATLTVTATKSGCPTTQTKSINLIALPTITTVSPTEGTVCSSTTISALEGTLSIDKSANSTTKWYKDGEEKSPTTTVETGKYTIKAVSNTGSCVSSTGVTYNVTGITTIPTELTIDINGQASASICEGTATINAKASGATSYSLYKGNGDLVEKKDGNANGVSFTVYEANTYKVKATNNCGSTEFSSGVTLTVNTVPSLTNVGNVTLCSSSTPISVENLITETGAKADNNSATIGLYAENGDEIEGYIDINVNTQTTTTYKLKASTQTCSSDFVSFTLTVNSLPDAPALTSPAPVCEGTKVNLPTEGLKWYDAETGGTEVQNTAIEATGTYWAAAMQNGCESATRTEYTITVNPLPTITEISGNNSAVLYEDVELTATGVTQGAEVKWYLGNDDTPVATGTTYTVTSENTGEVIVKAKAFLNGCESTAASHTVAFSAETCNNVADMTKIYLDVSANTGFITENKAYVSITASGNKSAKCGDTSGANQGNYIPKNDTWLGTMTKVAGENYIYEITIPNNVTINKGTTKLSFWNKSISSNSDIWEVQAILGQTISEGTNCMKLSNETKTHNDNRHSHLYCGTWTTYANKPAITAPAVKTLSFETTPGDGNINFSGQIVKTGCDNSLTYGYEYKKVGAANWTQVVLGTDLDKDAGFTFSDNNDKDLDGEYVVRAFITNDNSTQYGAEITKELSTTKDPVTKATIQLTDEEGNEVDKNKKYCVGETGYIKVTSDVKYTTIKWKTDKGTEIEETGNDGVYPFVAKGDDNIWVMLSNKHNKPESPAINENPLVVNTFADPILPRVSLNKVSICSNDAVGATVKLTNVVKGQTYQLYQQIDNGDDTFTEQAIGDTKTQIEEVTDKTELVLHTLNNTYTTGKYFVKTYTSDCEENKVATQPFTFTVVDAAEVFISIDPASAETTPWMPAKFTVNASDKYTLNVTKGNPAEPATEVEVNQNGNKVSVKIPLPEGTQHVTGQYQNVTFPQGATTQYTITATLSAAGGDNPCAAPTSATITLVPYEEECTKGH